MTSLYKADGSEETFDSGYDLFVLPSSDTATLRRYYEPIEASGQVNGSSALEFKLNPSQHYLSLADSILQLKVQIFKGKDPISKTDNVGLVNLPLSSMFKQVDLTIQNKPVSASIGNMYPYKSYLDALLSSTRDEKETRLQSQLYFPDLPGKFDASDCKVGGNAGLTSRYLYTAEGKVVDIAGKINTDFCAQGRYLLDNVRVNIKLHPSDDIFCLMWKGAQNYRLHITEATYLACYLVPNPAVVMGHA